MKNQKSFRFLDNFFSIGCFILWQVYLSPVVSVLTKGPTISDVSKRDAFELNLYLDDEIIG